MQYIPFAAKCCWIRSTSKRCLDPSTSESERRANDSYEIKRVTGEKLPSRMQVLAQYGFSRNKRGTAWASTGIKMQERTWWWAFYKSLKTQDHKHTYSFITCAVAGKRLTFTFVYFRFFFFLTCQQQIRAPCLTFDRAHAWSLTNMIDSSFL